MAARKVLVLGGNGQLGRALREVFRDAEFVARADFDVTDPAAWASRRWTDYKIMVNATAYTAVDQAETAEGRRSAWAVNVVAVSEMAKVATAHGITLVHVSSDYVFDGTTDVHTEDEGPSPLSVYGQTKAAGDAIVATVPHHYIIRTSWVIGDGNNFVRTMAQLAKKGASPKVVSDQVGRLTFASEIANAIAHLLNSGAGYGTYNCSNAGSPSSWAEIARTVFKHVGRAEGDVEDVTTAEFFEGRSAAPRPLQSTLDLTKLTRTGWHPTDWFAALVAYLV